MIVAESGIPDVVERLSKHAERWRHNSDAARINVRLGDLRALLSHTTRPVEWQARNAVIEECAKIADRFAVTEYDDDEDLDRFERGYVNASKSIAACIRGLSATPPRSLAIEEVSHDH